MEIYVRHVELLGFEKRLVPSGHYIYMLMVKWSDLSEKLVYRRYPEIHTFHKDLKEMFPIEAGDIDKKDKIIPSLPAPKWLDTQRATKTRQSTLAEYCQALISLPPKISRCQLVCTFFTVRPEDETPSGSQLIKRNGTSLTSGGSNLSEISGPIILDSYRVVADYNKTSNHEINLHTGDLVEIVEKSPNGWWFCQCEFKRGWVPSTYLEPLDGPDEPEEPEPNYAGEIYITTQAYSAAEDDELTLALEETVEVIHKLLDGWWVVRKGEETGHFPSMFLRPTGEKMKSSDMNKLKRQRPPPRRSTIRNAKSIHSKSRRGISQAQYRRKSIDFLNQRGNNGQSKRTQKYSNAPTGSPLMERKNEENIPKLVGSTNKDQAKKTIPSIPPRPSPQLIMERCTENTRRRVSVHKASTDSAELDQQS